MSFEQIVFKLRTIINNCENQYIDLHKYLENVTIARIQQKHIKTLLQKNINNNNILNYIII